jgi:magnesium transporter
MAKTKIKRKPKREKSLSKKSGLPSESMVYVGQNRDLKTSIQVMDYDGVQFTEQSHSHQDSLNHCMQSESITWVAVTGVQETEKIVSICNQFKIHPLVQEDILNTGQRTKLETFEEYLFVTFKNIYFNEEHLCLETEQISVILGSNYILTFQETQNEIFDNIINRLRISKGTIKNKKSDYLLYKLLDAAVDQYFILIDKISDIVEEIEEETMYSPNENTSKKIQNIKKELLILSKHILPMREVLNKLESGTSDFIDEKNYNYFRDVYDHTYQAYDTVENHRSLLNDLMNMYLTTTSNKLNQVMKVLTVISTIFMPLSFLTGYYGMNFKFFPGLNNPESIYYFWGI